MADILIIGRDLVRQLLPMDQCMVLMEQAFRAASDGSAVQGLRGITQVPGEAGGVLGVMPGGMTEPPRFGVKVISVLHGRAAQSHQGGVLLFDAADFAPLALIHAGEITAIRTAAATAVATRVLARPAANVLAVLGTGEQAETHIRAMALLRRWDDLRVWGRNLAKAQRLVAAVEVETGCVTRAVGSVAEAVAGAGVVCTLTAAATPILTADLIESGMHLNLVGSSVASTREVDSAVVALAKMYVDHEAMTRTAGGEFIAALREGAILPDHIRGEVGAVLSGRVAGRRSEDEVTLFKSLGMPVEDLVAADFVYAAARRLGLGTIAPF